MPRRPKKNSDYCARKARKQADVMAPAHAYMQNQAMLRIASTAQTLKAKTEDPEIRNWLNTMQDMKRPIVGRYGETCETLCRHSTLGMGLMGAPEIGLAWPEGLHDAAFGILEDLKLSVMNGEMHQLAVGRTVYAVRFGIGYVVRDASECSDWSPVHDFLKEHTQRKPDIPFAVRLDMVVDLRDGIDLPGLKGCMALYKKKGGVSTFTGVVKTPMPSPYYAANGSDYGVARLADGNANDIEGPIRMLTLEEFQERMSVYD